MINLRPIYHTRTFGGPGFNKLYVTDAVDTDGDAIMMTLWEPTPDELAKIAAGRPIAVIIMGTKHPPLSVEVLKEDTNDETIG